MSLQVPPTEVRASTVLEYVLSYVVLGLSNIFSAPFKALAGLCAIHVV